MTRNVENMRAELLGWYDKDGRSLPWRLRPEDKAAGASADPYAVWLSEIMLQQTTVPHAAPYWEKFLAAFPTVTELANAPRDQVLSLWAGLGYYARARNLHKCAAVLRDQYGGIFPQSEAALLTLPGIGPYTAAAIAAICFDEPTNIVDGNVERVISRIFAVQNPLPKAKGELRDFAAKLADPKRPGDYGQALMDLGATICTPKNPKCEICVWQKCCAAFKVDNPQDYPKKIKKKKLATRYGAIFWLEREGSVLIRQRLETGLLGAMMEFPGSEWGDKPKNEDEWLRAAPAPRNWERLEAPVLHIFTHFKLELSVYRAHISMDEVSADELGNICAPQTRSAQTRNTQASRAQAIWADIDDLSAHALPSLMMKVAKLARGL